MIVLWNQSLIVGQECYFETRKLSQKEIENQDDDRDDDGDNTENKDVVIKKLLDGYQEEQTFCSELLSKHHTILQIHYFWVKKEKPLLNQLRMPSMPQQCQHMI